MAEGGGEATTLLTHGGSNRSYRSSEVNRYIDISRLEAGDEETGELYNNTAFNGKDEDIIAKQTPAASLPKPEPSTSAAQQTPSTYDMPLGDRPNTEEELLFRLRFAHLSPGADWFDEVASTSRLAGDVSVYEHVLLTMREYPLRMSEKLLLSGQIRARLEAGSMISTASKADRLRRDMETGKGKGKKSPHHVVWSSGGLVPFGLWDTSIGRIAAYFGTHVASYFQFLRFLALMNAGIGLIMFIFVSLPQIIPNEMISDDVKSGFFGELSNTIFFYGAYSNSSSTIDIIHLSYDRPLAYLMTWSCVNVLTVLIIVICMYVNYRRIKKTDDSGEDPFSSQTLLGWDHSVTSREGSKIRSSAITTQFKEMFREEKVKRRLTTREKVQLWSVRVLCNVFSLAVFGGTGYLIYYVAEHTIEPGQDIPPVLGDFFKKYQLPILVSVLKVVIPPLLSLSLILEKYHPRTQIKIQIARTAVFYVASLVVFLASIFSISTECMSASAPTNHSQQEYCCWENEVGEQMFQVVILDLIVSVLVGLIIKGGRAVIIRCCHYRRFGYQNFNVAGLILDLVYGQSLIWLGLYSAPFFALVGVVKLVILFYFNYVMARACCVPPAKVFRASRSGTFYLFILLVTLFVCFLPMTYAIIALEPSRACGPFKTDMHVYEVLTDKIGESPDWIQTIFRYASTPAVVIPLLIILILLVLYYRAKSSAHKMEAKDLRYHLQFERKVEKRKVFARARLVHGASVASGLDVGNPRGRGIVKVD